MRFSGVLNAVERVFWGFILRFIHFTRGQVRVESCIFRTSPYHVRVQTEKDGFLPVFMSVFVKKTPKFIKWGYHVRVYYVFMLFFILLFHKVYFLTCNFFEKKQKKCP